MNDDTDRGAFFKTDFARHIDLVIDYFGEAEASASRREAPGSGPDSLAAPAGWGLPLD